MGDVVVMDVMTRLDIPIDRILEQAQGQLQGGLVIGWDHEGELFMGLSYASCPESLWLLEMAKKALLSTED